MLFVMEFKCKLYQQDSTLLAFVKNACQIPGMTGDLLEACGQYAYQAAFRNLEVCKAAFAMSIELTLRENPTRCAKLPTLFRQVLTLNSDDLAQQQSLINQIEMLLKGLLVSWCSLIEQICTSKIKDNNAQQILSNQLHSSKHIRNWRHKHLSHTCGINA